MPSILSVDYIVARQVDLERAARSSRLRRIIARCCRN